jgi:molybdopterin-guanine dinucleotide biosynthesis protein A
MMQNKHSKHAKLAKPNYGKFARNEWALLGAPCDVIKTIVERIADIAEVPILYIDESHNHSASVSNLSVTTKKGERQSFSNGLDWNKNGNFLAFDEFDYVLVNGNHFKADKQIVILDPRKEESLSRKLDRLSNLKAIIYTDEAKDPYAFLRDEEGVDIDVPRFHISDTEALLTFIMSDIEVPILKSLILAGGKSQRMGQDKGGIDYHGKGQAKYMYDLVEELGVESYVSCRKEQSSNYKELRQVHDKFLGLGPFGAIASAFMEDPNAAWLVIPCDLPLLEEKHLKMLLSGRKPSKFATAFLNEQTKFPEPLISIWEPKMYQRMMGFLSQGYSCPRKVLINSDVNLIEVAQQDFMMNVNTPEELKKATQIIEER